MSDSHLNYSVELQIPAGKLELAKKIIKDEGDRLETYTSFVEIDEKRMMLWFHDDDGFASLEELVEPIARALIDGLEIDEPFILEWANICDKPVCEQFGGGAFVIMRGCETYWIYPSLLASNWIKNRKKRLGAKKSQEQQVRGVKIAKCKFCKRDMKVAVSCIDRREVFEVDKHQPLKEKPPVRADRDCGDCNVKEGSIHHPGCDQERCPNCGGQLISCDCGHTGCYPVKRGRKE